MINYYIRKWRGRTFIDAWNFGLHLSFWYEAGVDPEEQKGDPISKYATPFVIYSFAEVESWEGGNGQMAIEFYAVNNIILN